MKRLILIRHAKSRWNSQSGDHARTLNENGRASAAAIGRWLNECGYIPDAIYSSDARRTQETSEGVAAAFDHPPEIEYRRSLYHASAATLLNTLRKGNADTIAIVGHNPGISEFAQGMVCNAPKHNRFSTYPTAATLVCDFDIAAWSEVAPRSGQTVEFIVPRDLDQ